MGLSSEMNKVSAAINCALKQLGGGDCWKPQSDFSPELLLGFYLGFFKGRSCRGGLCYPVGNYGDGGDQAGADLVAEVRGVGGALIGMYAAGDIIIKIDGEPWLPETVDEDGNDIWIRIPMLYGLLLIILWDFLYGTRN